LDVPIPEDILARLRLVCLDLPEATEENAWTGVRWSVAKKNFAHVVEIKGGQPPAYATAAGVADAIVLTFRASATRIASPRFSRAPFFKPVWFKGIVGVALDAATDWDEIETLIVESYRLLAPKKLAALVEGRE
jgi:predicted DNA-binding protein (MmcQ/YjbR family)